MKDPSAEVQRAVYAALMASAGLASAMGGTARVYDKVLANPTYPFIRIGDDQMLDQSNSCADGWDAGITLHIFAKHAKWPRMECKAIIDQALRALTTLGAFPTPTGYVVKTASLDQSRTYFEADGLTAHGVLAITYRLRELA